MKPDKWERRMRALLKKMGVAEEVKIGDGLTIFPQNVIITEIISLLAQQRNRVCETLMKELK